MAERKENFRSQYRKLCLENKVFPAKSVVKYCKNTEFCCPVEAIRHEQWKYMLHALSIDNSLTKVHFASCVSPHEEEDEPCKNDRIKQNMCFPVPYGRLEKNINDITLSISAMLNFSRTLIILKLENLSLTTLDADHLSLGLSDSHYLKFLSVSGCHFDEGAVPILCRGLSGSCVSWVDFSNCALNIPDIEAISNVIKAHNIRRCNQMFPNTLRYTIPLLQELPGLNRVSLNYNSLEEEALNLLVESLTDDLWMKALDLQNCDIDDNGAEKLLDLVKSNASIMLVDLRLNEIDDLLQARILKQLSLNKVGKHLKYMELPLWRPSELVRKYNSIGKVKVIKRPSGLKVRVIRRASRSLNHSVKLSKAIHQKSAYSKDVSVQTFNEGAKDLPKTLLEYVNEMKVRLQKEVSEKIAYHSLCKQMKAENDHLREMVRSQNDDIYIDQETYFDIKHTFEKLKIFFEVMKKYGLWEYISLLGFDESTDVIVEETDSQKCIKVTRNDTYYDLETTPEPERDVCCICRTLDSKHKNAEPPNHPPRNSQNCVVAPSTKPSQNKSKVTMKDDPMNERVAYRLLQEVMNDYSNASSQQAPNSKQASGRMSEAACGPQDNSKPSSSKQCGSTSPKTTGAHMLIKKFSYSNMPKQLKDLVSPADFYNIVKKELERCESEARRPISSSKAENPALASANALHTKQNLCKVANHKSEVKPTSVERKETPAKMLSKVCSEEEHDSLTISELIARERAAKQVKKESARSSASSLSNKIHKNTNHAKIKETKTLIKSEQMLPKSKLKLSSSSQTVSPASSKKVSPRSNASSDEINSSDSIVTASDKLSQSSASSSSSNKSLAKSSSVHSESEPQKSYIESVSDASTSKDVESIADMEIASQVLQSCLSNAEAIEKESLSKDKVVKTTNDGSVNSESSTVKETSDSKGSNSNTPVTVGSISIKDASKKSDKSTKTNSSPQGKTKNSNKNNKNRPKSNSSKSSCIPSLSDITTVSSQSLNTESVMKQISAGEDKSRGEK